MWLAFRVMTLWRKDARLCSFYFCTGGGGLQDRDTIIPPASHLMDWANTWLGLRLCPAVQWKLDYIFFLDIHGVSPPQLPRCKEN